MKKITFTISGHSGFTKWPTVKKRSNRRPPPRDYEADEKIVAEALILLSQTTAEDAAGFPPKEPSPNEPTVQNNCSVASPSRHSVGGEEISQWIVKPTASGDCKIAASTTNRKLYKCSVCGQCFDRGQALGGHKRMHFTGVIVRKSAGGKKSLISLSGSVPTGTGGASSDGGEVGPSPPCRGLNIDLNLPPPPEN